MMVGVLLLLLVLRETEANDSCEENATGHVYFAGIFDQETGGYANFSKHHFDLTVQLINNKTDGFWDDLLPDTEIKSIRAHSGCSEHLGAPAYWSIRKWGKPLHGVVGARCSGPSMAIARVAQLEHVPQISFSATSPKLSSTTDFPYFYRTVSPDGADGGVGATVQFMRHFGWERVTVLYSDKAWARDTASQFTTLWAGAHTDDPVNTWHGKVPFSHMITLDADGSLSQDSVQQAFAAIPVGDPTVNTRIIYLVVHAEDAWPIFKYAVESGFQADSVFVGPGSWGGESLPAHLSASLGDRTPGYFALVPFRNPAQENQQYLTRFQQYERERGMGISSSISKYGANAVDAVVTLAKALTGIPHAQRRNGTLVRTRIEQTAFAGVSGNIQFDEHGDRMNPLFTVLNAYKASTGQFEWRNVGSIGPQPGTSTIQNQLLCWAAQQQGCGNSPPSDRYPVPPPPPTPEASFPAWILAPIIGLLALLVGVSGKFLLQPICPQTEHECRETF